MIKKTKKLLKEKRFFKKVRGFRRFLLFFGIYFLTVLMLLSISAEITSRPSFCPTCHYMETFYQSWRTSAHNDVDCVECHFEPGISGTVKGKLNGLVQIVNYLSLSYKKRKPWAEIPDHACERSGCHETQAFRDTTFTFKGISFNHKNHLKEQKRGKTLKCTSCHSQIVQGSHIEVTTSTCVNCHFKKSDDPEHKYDKLSDCNTCHNWKDMSKEEMADYSYNHALVVQNDISCTNCHSNTIKGDGFVSKERCFQCHFETERLEKYDNTEFMHTTHISKHSMKCFVCHSTIEHKVQKIDPDEPPECLNCHGDAHSYQVSLFTGENGIEVESTPSIMFLNGINCKGCHIFHEVEKGVDIEYAGSGSCDHCHGPGYDNLVKQWETASIKRLATINSIYKTVSYQINSSNSDKRTEADITLKQAYHNIRIVEVGKSVHNIEFADKLLMSSYNLIKKALTLIGSSANLPEFKSDTEFIPNACYSCHAGIQEISVKKFGMDFSHNLHIVKNRVACEKCHSNAQKHGELILNQSNCNSCHHSKGKTNDACIKCHDVQSKVYDGSYLRFGQPDYMKEGGVGCIDCHVVSDKLIKPDKKICLKCHDQGYADMMSDWDKEVKELIKESNGVIKNLDESKLSSEEKQEVKQIKNILYNLKKYPSLYVHNYELVSTIFSKKLKELKGFSD
ncbi:cytochrome c3 family protein [Bacteroidota bacterium]